MLTVTMKEIRPILAKVNSKFAKIPHYSDSRVGYQRIKLFKQLSAEDTHKFQQELSKAFPGHWFEVYDWEWNHWSCRSPFPVTCIRYGRK